jgi:ABC-type polysaccharide/polyol phosphate export permease
MKLFDNILKEKQRNLLKQLIKKDFKDRYLGSYLGAIWIFIQPVITIFIFWFIFQVGFKSVPVEGIPFILWLVSGMLPWLYFSETLVSSNNVIIDNKFLIKNVVFDIRILHISKIVSSILVHLFFVCFLVTMFFYYGFTPNIYY